MLCPTCGEPISEELDFCPNCGTKLSREQQTPVNEQTQAAAEVPETPAFAQADFQDAPKKKVNKKKLGVTLAIIGGILAAAAILAVVFWSQVSGFFIKTFGSPEDYFQHVEKQAAVEAADTVSEYYETILNNTQAGEYAVEGTLRMKISEKLLELAGIGAEDMDLDWLNDLVVNYETVKDGDLIMMNMVLAISETDIVDMSMIADMVSEDIYMGLPSLSNQFLLFESDNYYGTSSSLQNLLSDEEFLKALPDDSTVNKLLRKYLQLIAENATNVEKESETLQIGDIEQKVTVLEYELTERGLMKICKAVLKEAKNDKDLKKCIINFAEYLQKQGAVDDADAAYDAFQSAVELALESMNGAETSSETILVLTDYVDGAGDIIGRKLEVEGQTILDYATLTKGKDFATEWKIGDDGQLVLRGEGTVSGGVREGNYMLSVEGVDFLELYASYNEDKLPKGELEGTFRLTPSAALLDNMDSQTKALIGTMNLSLELIISADKDEASVEMNLLSGKEVLFGLVSEASATEGKPITLPDNTISDYYADDWAMNLDFDKIIDALRKTEVPKELVDALKLSIDMMTDPYYYYNNYYG